MRKELEITIGPDGEMQIVTHGFKGDECLEAVKPFEGEVGIVKRRTLTGEYYERPQTREQQRAWRR